MENISYLDFKIDEPLLTETQRFTLFPIKYPTIYDTYKKQLASFWTVEEIDFSKDAEHWSDKLNDNERKFIKMILAFFAGADGIVNLNLMENFSKEVKILEAQMVYNVQCMIESIHSETYSLMIDTLIKDNEEKNLLFNAIETIPCIQQKAEWALKWFNNAKTVEFSKRLLGFAIVEGIFFSGAFCAIYWLKQRGLMHGLTKSNEFIARDEGMHCEFAILLYSMLKNKLDECEVHNIITEAVYIEKEFIINSLDCKLIGMNADLMSQYIEYVADRLCVSLKYSKIYYSKNPFEFMNLIGMESRSNFFDERTSTYQKSSFGSTVINYSDDF
jgi:ribonucleoside-diphosphate reductase beta chain